MTEDLRALWNARRRHFMTLHAGTPVMKFVSILYWRFADVNRRVWTGCGAQRKAIERSLNQNIVERSCDLLSSTTRSALRFLSIVHFDPAFLGEFARLRPPEKRRGTEVMDSPLEEMAKLQKEKQKYEAKRSRLRIELDRTEHKIGELQSKYGGIHNATSAPILRLPNEITCMIFDYALALSVRMAEGRPVVFGKAWRPPLVEVVISHVCHQWRSIGLSYPQIWSHFRYEVSRSSVVQVPLERFDAYLERSRSAGLELWFDFQRDLDLGQADAVLSLLEKAVPHISRWRRFTLLAHPEVPVLCLLDPIFFQSSSSAPMLEHLALSIRPTIDFDMEERSKELHANIFPNGASNLKSVTLHPNTTMFCFPRISTLTTLRLETPDLRDDIRLSWTVLRDLLTLPTLVNLSIMFNASLMSALDSDNFLPIAMNSLRHLRISHFNSLAYFLLLIRAPLLESLTIKEITFTDGFSTSARNSDGGPHVFPSLKSLCFINVKAETPEAWYFAEMTPNATEITAHGDYLESLLEALTICSEHHERKTLWPKLRVINFNMDADVADSLDELVCLAEGRSEKDAITLRLSDDIDYMFETWTGNFFKSATYKRLAKAYCVEVVDSRSPPDWLDARQVRWPPQPASGVWDEGLLVYDSDDPFNIIISEFFGDYN